MKEKILKIFNYWRTYPLWIGKNNSNHQTKEINLKKSREEFSGRKFRELIRYHMQRQKYEKITDEIVKIAKMFNPIEKEVVQKVMDCFNARY